MCGNGEGDRSYLCGNGWGWGQGLAGTVGDGFQFHGDGWGWDGINCRPRAALYHGSLHTVAVDVTNHW